MKNQSTTIHHTLSILFIALAITSCRPLGDDLFSYGQKDNQAFAAAEMSFEGEFRTFWLAMNENYCIWDYEADFGVDWDEVYKTYLPQFEALDKRQTGVSDAELKALYQQFLDSLHDGHMAFQIKNLSSGNYIVVYPNEDRNMRERPQVYTDEANATTLDVYRTSAVEARYQIRSYGATGNTDIIAQLIDTMAHRLLRGTTAYLQAVDEAGGPTSFNDTVYAAVQRLQQNAQMMLYYLSLPKVLNSETAGLASFYNEVSRRYSIIAKQVGVDLPLLEDKLAEDNLKYIRFALFEGNIAYLRLGGFYLSEHMPDDALVSDTTSSYYAYQLAVRAVWHQWFDTIQTLHAAGQLGGVIIDVRNNGGGRTDDYQYALGALMPSGGWSSHTLRVKNGIGRLDFAPLIPFTVKTYPDDHAVISQEPIVVLANSHSVSMSENTTWGVKNQPNGYVIGTRTFGALSALSTDPAAYSDTYSGAFGVRDVTPIYGYVPKLICLYSQADGRLRPVEGYGFEPNESVPFNLSLWQTAGRDNQLEKALDYIHSK